MQNIFGQHKSSIKSSIFEALSVSIDEKRKSESTEQKISQSSKVDSPIFSKAPIIGVLGSKGGVGSSTFALNLSFALAQSESEETTLLDLNMQQPDLSVMLGRQPKYTLKDFIKRGQNIDRKVFEALSESILDKQNQNLKLISPPLDIEEGLATNLTEVPDVLPVLQKQTGLIVLDLPKQLDRGLMGLLDKCDLIILVVEPSLTSMLASKRWLSTFFELGYPQSKVAAIINRAGGKLSHFDSEIKSQLKISPIWKLPGAYKSLEESSLAGEPLVIKEPKHSYSKSIFQIAKKTYAYIKELSSINGDDNV